MIDTLSQLAEVVDGRLHGDDQSFSGVSTDTRSIRKDQLFVALKGPNFDGNEYVPEAANTGASGALVERLSENISFSQIVVPDARKALGVYAHAWRNQFDIPVAAITGSNGKTTIKQLLSAILAVRGPVLSTRGNLNNDIGLPLTLLDMRPHHWAAVIEMGANHHGEIALLTNLAKPDVGVLSNANAAHLEGFGSIKGVAEAKGELFENMPESSTAIINNDDQYAEFWKTLAAPREIKTFGLSSEADFYAVNLHHDIQNDQPLLSFDLIHGGQEQRISINFPGRHNVYNTLAAAAAATSLGLTLEEISIGVKGAKPAASRLNVSVTDDGVRIIDDSYNANPDSLRAGVELLCQMEGQPWLVLGDMAELGDLAESMHRDAGVMAKEHGVERLFATGQFSRFAVDAFGAGADHFESQQAMASAIQKDWSNGVNILVKASRSMGFEHVVAALLKEGGR